MVRTGLVIAAVWLLTPAPVADAQNPPLKVYIGGTKVDATKDVNDATKNALKAKFDQAREARKALENQIKSQHGKKMENWPLDQLEALYTQWEAEFLAQANYEYRKVDPKKVEDSVKDMLNVLNGKGAEHAPHVSLTASPADADLAVEVLARRSEKSMPTKTVADMCYVFFSIAPGPKLAAGGFDAVPRTYRIRQGSVWGPQLGIYRVVGPTPEFPGFKFESNNEKTHTAAYGSFGCWGAAANAAVTGVDKFIEDNYAALTAKAVAK